MSSLDETVKAQFEWAPGTMIRRSACYWESHGATRNRIPLLSKRRLCFLPCGCGGLRGGVPRSNLLPLWSAKERRPMAWTTPTLIEICIGLEINGYLPAEF
jgi:coenzyme PQQ precursor peptide PqqA